MRSDISIIPGPIRSINARITFRDAHLRFRKFPISDAGNDSLAHDVSAYGTGFLRVACRPAQGGWYLHYQYVPSPNAFTNPLADYWPAWVNAGVALDPYSGLGIEAGRVFYRSPAGSVDCADFDGQSFVPRRLFAAPERPYAFAPINADEVYLQWKPDLEAPYARIARYCVSSATRLDWPGRLYPSSPWLSGLDALRLNGRDLIYFADEAGKRTLYLTWEGLWSEVRPLIPMDVVDDTSSFTLGGASLIHGQVWLAGVLKRDQNFPMHIYTREIAPGHYSLDRELFIRSGQTQEKLVDGRPYVSPPGKLLLVDDILWYVAVGSVYYAYATQLCGCDRPAYRLQTGALAGLNASFASNQPYTLSADLAHDLPSALTGAGCEATLEVGYAGEYAQIGRFEISVGSDGAEQTGRTRRLLAHSYACKRLSQWEPDASFDLWSQTKVGCRPSDLTRLVRVSGQYHGTDELRLDRLNLDGFLYAVDRPSRSHLVRARFRFPAGPDYTPACGVAAAFFSSAELGCNGLVGVYEAGVVSLRLLRGDAFIILAESPLTLPPEAWFWLQIAFHDGDIRVQYRQETSEQPTEWLTALVYTFQGADSPWVRDDYVGRGALYLRNTTPHAESYPFAAADPIIPLRENAVFPPADAVIVDDEIIEYAGKSYGVRQDDLLPALGDAMVGNANLDGLEGWLAFACRPGMQISAAIQTFLLPANYYVSGAQVYLRKKPGMTQDLRLAIYQGPKNAKRPVGVKVASGLVANADLSETGSWVTANFGAPMFLNKANAYWIILSQDDDPGDPKGPGFELGYTAAAVQGALYTFDEDHDRWLPQSGDALFGLLGSASVNAWAIFLENLIPPGDPAQYNDMALVITAGTGKDELFKVVGFGGATESGHFILFVDRNPEGVIGADSVFVLAPTLKVKSRGAQETSAVAHGETLVSVWRNLSAAGSYFNYYSAEVDLRIEDVAQEIAAKAGVVACSDRRMAETIPIPAEGARTPVVLARNFIVRFRLQPNCYFDLAIRSLVENMTEEPGGLTLYAHTDGQRIDLELLGRAWESLEYAGFDLGGANAWLTVSMFENHLAVWANDYFLHAFDLEAHPGRIEQPGLANALWCWPEEEGFDLCIDWSQCDQRRDNSILDMGTNGLGLLSELFKERRIYFQDDSRGRLRLFRERMSLANPDGQPYALAALSSSNETDSDFASRVRLVGAEIAEGYDRSALAEYGNVFRLLYSQALDYEEEIVQEAARHIVDAVASRDQHALVGAFDPRLEPGDVINVLVNGEKAVQLVIDSLTLALTLDGNNAALDMQIEGRRYIPYDGGSDLIVASTASPLDWSEGLEDPTGPARPAILYGRDGRLLAFPATLDGLKAAFERLGANETLFIPPVDIAFQEPTGIILPQGAAMIGSGKDATLLRGSLHLVLGAGAALRDIQIVSEIGKEFYPNYRYLVFADHPALIQNCKLTLDVTDSHAVLILNRSQSLLVRNTDAAARATGTVGSVPAEAACIANLGRGGRTALFYGGEAVSSGRVKADQDHPPLPPDFETVAPDGITISGAIQRENG